MPKEAEEMEAARLEYQAKGKPLSPMTKRIQEIRSLKSPLRHLKPQKKA